MNHTKTLIIVLAAAMTLVLTAYADMETTEGQSQQIQKTPVLQTGCPIMEGEINKELYADYQGKRIYFCCKGCINMFMKEPDKYMKEMEDQGITLEDTPNPQHKCPVMGKEVNKELFVDYDGKRVFFCCQMCVDKFKKDPNTYLKKLLDEGVSLEIAPGWNPAIKSKLSESEEKELSEKLIKSRGCCG
jgi:YHS domain-containing protein